MKQIIFGFFSLLSVSLLAQEGATIARTPAQMAASDQKQDSSRSAIHQQQKRELQTLEERRTKISADYESEMKKLQLVREELRAAHGKRQLELIGKLSSIEEKFQAQLHQIRNKRNKVFTDNAAKIVELDRELQGIQEKAREQYTDEVSNLLKAHDEKRKAQEKARVAAAEAVEDERVAALNAYFESLANHEVSAQVETQTMDKAKADQIAEHAAKAAELANVYQQQLTNLAQERARVVQAAADSLYTLLQVPNRTVPAIVGQQAGAKARGLADLAAGEEIGMTFTYAGVELKAADPIAVAIKAGIESVTGGNYAEGFSFSNKGEILYRDKPLTIQLSHSVGGIPMVLPASVEAKMQQTILGALIQNLYRTPVEKFTGLQFEPTTPEGNAVKYREVPRLPVVLTAILTGQKESLQGVTQVDEQTFALDGKSYRVKWYVAEAGKLTPLATRPAAEQQDVQARWQRQLKRSLATITVPSEVRARLAAPVAVEGSAQAKLARLLTAPEACKAYTFIQDGNDDVVVVRRSDKAILLRASGVKDLSGVACTAESMAFIAHTIKGTERLKVDVNRSPGSDIPVADLVITDRHVQSKDSAPTLFVVHQETLKIAILSPGGRFAKVQAIPSPQPGVFRTWSVDSTGQWMVDFTISVPFDASGAGPDIGSEPPKATDLNGVEAK